MGWLDILFTTMPVKVGFQTYHIDSIISFFNFLIRKHYDTIVF
jgi:hypothetical protein